MAEFYKNMKFPKQNSDKVMTLDNNKIMKSTNISIEDVTNTISKANTNESNISELTTKVNALEASMGNVEERLQNINGEEVNNV